MSEYDQFFVDFPEYTDVVAFTHQTEKMDAIVEEVKCEYPFFDGGSLYLITHNCCVSIGLNERTLYVLNIDEDYDFWGSVSWPLLVRDKDNEQLRHFIFHHEAGHILGSILNPYEFSVGNVLLESEEDTEQRHLSEEYADCYAALRVIQKYGDDGTEFVRKFADSRLLSAIKSGNTRHLTTRVLDAVYNMAQNSDFIAQVQSASPQDIANISQTIVKSNHQPTLEKAQHLDEWKEAIFYPSGDTLLYPSIPRLMDAIGRQVDVPDQELDTYLDRLDFKKGDLSKAFTRSSILKAIVGLKISLVNAEAMQDTQQHLEDGLSNTQKDWNACSNQYPDLEDFAQEVKRTFVGDKFAVLSALSSREFTNDLACKYLTRQAIQKIDHVSFFLST